MARPDGRIEKGQRLATAISARAWNRAQEAADRVLGAGTGAEAGPITFTSAPYHWVYAKNGTGSTVDRWGIMSITGVEVTPTSQETAAATVQFQSMPVVTGGTPEATTIAWCVALEPIISEKIGRVAVAGVVQVKAADLGKAVGACVLWKNSDWALIRMEGGLRLGTISATWNKGSTATVQEQFGDGSAKTGSPTFTATNYFATVTVSSGTRRVACGKVDDKWLLIAAECS